MLKPIKELGSWAQILAKFKQAQQRNMGGSVKMFAEDEYLQQAFAKHCNPTKLRCLYSVHMEYLSILLKHLSTMLLVHVKVKTPLYHASCTCKR